MTKSVLIYDESGGAGCALAQDVLDEQYAVALCVQGHAKARSLAKAFAGYAADQVSIHQVLDGHDATAKVFRACAK